MLAGESQLRFVAIVSLSFFAEFLSALVASIPYEFATYHVREYSISSGIHYCETARIDCRPAQYGMQIAFGESIASPSAPIAAPSFGLTC